MPQVILNKNGGIPKLRLIAGDAQFINYLLDFTSPEGHPGMTIDENLANAQEMANGFDFTEDVGSVEDFKDQILKWVIRLDAGAEGEQYSVKMSFIQDGEEKGILTKNGTFPVDDINGEVEIKVQ